MVRPSKSIALGLALAGLWGYSRWALARLESLPLAQVPRPGKVARVQGLELHYVEQGQGEAIVLIHGLGSSTYNFRHTIPALAQAFRAVALDLPGFGLSERPQDRSLSLSTLAEIVRGLLDHLGVERAHVVGHSLGGMVGARLAAGFPQRVGKLVLVASPLQMAAPGLLAAPLLEPLWATALGLLLAHRPLRELIWRSGYYDPAALTAEDREHYFLPSRIQGYSRCLLGLLRSLPHDPPPELSRLSLPVLILWGEADRAFTSPARGRQLRDGLPDGRLQVIPRAGHMLLEERPQEANAAILAFLS